MNPKYVKKAIDEIDKTINDRKQFDRVDFMACEF